MSLIYKTFVTGTPGMDGRSYLLTCSETGCSAVIDPDRNAEELLSALPEGGKLAFILLTHGHFDHIGDVDILRDKTGCPLYIHAADGEMLTEPMLNVSGYEFFEPIIRRPAERLLQGGEILPLGKLNIEVLHTPGHSPGSTCYLCEGKLFSGDTLLSGTIGRMDLPGGSMAQMRTTLARLFTLPEDTPVLGGHGRPSTMEEEARNLGFKK